MALVVGFTYIETKGLTLEQIQQRFEGVKRQDIRALAEVYNGEKPLQDFELEHTTTRDEGVVEEVTEKGAPKS